MDALAWPKISKRHFLKDIENSFHEVSHIGLEPHQFFERELSSLSQRTLDLLEWKLFVDFSKSITNVASKDT